VSAHKKAHTQVRPDNSFSYFYERNLVSVLLKYRLTPGAGRYTLTMKHHDV
jgi:hypothetical protein